MPRKTPAAPQTTTAPLQIENAAQRSGELVTVACKMPGGLLLRVFDMIDNDIPVLGGGMKTVKVAQQREQVVRLNGTSLGFGQVPNHRIVGGYALTQNVSKEFFDFWLKQNKDLDLVKNGLVFAQPSEAKTVGQAEEQAKVMSMLEPLNPAKDAKDPRMPRGIETADKPGAKAA